MRYETIESGLGVWVLTRGVQAAAIFEALQVGNRVYPIHKLVVALFAMDCIANNRVRRLAALVAFTVLLFSYPPPPPPSYHGGIIYGVEKGGELY